MVSSGNCSHDAPCEWLWVVLGACRGEGQVCQLEFRAHGHSGRASRRNEEGGQKFQEAVCRSLRFLVVSKEGHKEGRRAWALVGVDSEPGLLFLTPCCRGPLGAVSLHRGRPVAMQSLCAALCFPASVLGAFAPMQLPFPAALLAFRTSLFIFSFIHNFMLLPVCLLGPAWLSVPADLELVSIGCPIAEGRPCHQTVPGPGEQFSAAFVQTDCRAQSNSNPLDPCGLLSHQSLGRVLSLRICSALLLWCQK